MKPIERVRGVQQVVAAVKNQLSWEDTELFFKRFGLKPPYFEHSHGIEDLTRAYLDQCSDDMLIEIAEQLGLTEPQATSERRGESKYWLNDHFRLFISHVHTVKEQVASLKTSLQKFSISAFVAHEDIKPSAEWREEILKALYSMDALLAVLTPDFTSSKWTDQEVGAAVYKDVLIIPINRGATPYGFIEKYQAFKAKEIPVGEVAEKIFKTIYESEKTRERMIQCLGSTIATAPDVATAALKASKLAEIPNVPISTWESVRENVGANPVLKGSEEFVFTLNKLLKEVGVTPLTFGARSFDKALDDEIPF